LRWLQASPVLPQLQVLQLRLEQQRVRQVLQLEVLLVELQEVPEDQPEAHLPQQVQTQRRIDQKAWILKKKMVTMK
jgi:hypothetical protein